MPPNDKIQKQNLASDLKRLSAISDWFEKQEEIDVEEGLSKVREAATLIKVSKERLKEVANEFEEIKKDMEVEEGDEDDDSEEDDEEKMDPADIPF